MVRNKNYRDRKYDIEAFDIQPSKMKLILDLFSFDSSFLHSSYTIKIFEKIYKLSDCFNVDFPYLSAVDLILDYAFLFDSFCKIATMCLKYVLCVDKCDIKKYIID